MNNLNYVFFEEFKRLEKLCNEIYKVHNGITCYIDDMTATYNNYYNVPNWQSDLKQLKRLRHIRNNLAHEEGAFSQNLCTQNDVKWVRTFYQRIVNQSDPLSIQRRSSQTYQASNSSALSTIITTSIVIIVILAILMAFGL